MLQNLIITGPIFVLQSKLAIYHEKYIVYLVPYCTLIFPKDQKILHAQHVCETGELSTFLSLQP